MTREISLRNARLVYIVTFENQSIHWICDYKEKRTKSYTIISLDAENYLSNSA